MAENGQVEHASTKDELPNDIELSKLRSGRALLLKQQVYPCTIFKYQKWDNLYDLNLVAFRGRLGYFHLTIISR